MFAPGFVFEYPLGETLYLSKAKRTVVFNEDYNVVGPESLHGHNTIPDDYL